MASTNTFIAYQIIWIYMYNRHNTYNTKVNLLS